MPLPLFYIGDEIMEKLRVQKNNIYKIEVNDDGEYIEFDLEDIGLRTKCFRALDEIKKIEKEYNKKIKNIKTNKEAAFIEEEFYKELRVAMDGFLGEGACQKIYGDRNYPSMFDDLFKELTRKRKELGGKSHFDMLQLSNEHINKKIEKKYKKNSKSVI